jgi:hypothetical protein
MSLLDLATLASGVSDVLAWTRHLFALPSPPPRPHWRFRHRKLDIGRGWLHYESETAFRSTGTRGHPNNSRSAAKAIDTPRPKMLRTQPKAPAALLP